MLTYIRETMAYPILKSFSMYGIKAPGALSFRPLAKHMQQQESSLHLFIGGFFRVWTTSATSIAAGLGDLLISRSPFGAFGVWAPLGVGVIDGPWVISSSSYPDTASRVLGPFRTAAAGGPVMGELASKLMKAPAV